MVLPEEDEEPDNMIEARSAKSEISKEGDNTKKGPRIMKRRGEKDYIYI